MISMYPTIEEILEMVHLKSPQMMQGEALYLRESLELQGESFPDSPPLIDKLEEILTTKPGSSLSIGEPLQTLPHMILGGEYRVVSRMNKQELFPEIPRPTMTIQELFPEIPRPTIFEKSLRSAQPVIQGIIPAPNQKPEQTMLPVHTQEPVKQMFLARIQKKMGKIIAARKPQHLAAMLNRLHLLQIQPLTLRQCRSYVMRP